MDLSVNDAENVKQTKSTAIFAVGFIINIMLNIEANHNLKAIRIAIYYTEYHQIKSIHVCDWIYIFRDGFDIDSK